VIPPGPTGAAVAPAEAEGPAEAPTEARPVGAAPQPSPDAPAAASVVEHVFNNSPDDLDRLADLLATDARIIEIQVER